MIDKTFVQEISRLTELQMRVSFSKTGDTPAEPGDVYYMHEPGCRAVRCVAESLRSYTALRVRDLADLVEDRCRIGDFPLIYVFCGLGRACAIFGEDERRHVASFTAKPGAQMQSVAALAGKKLGVREFVQMLRVELAGCVPADFVAWCRQLKFTARTDSESDLQAGRESLGRKIEQQLSGAGAVPEAVTLSVPPFEDLVDDAGVLLRFPVECAVDVDYAAAQLRLVPLAGEVAKAHRRADEWIAAQLKPLEGKGTDATTVRVFCGS